MAGYKNDFNSNVDYAFGQTGKRMGGAFDMTSRIDAAAKSMGAYTKQLNSNRNAIKNATRDIGSMNVQLSQTIMGSPEWTKLNDKIGQTAENLSGLKSAMKDVPFDIMTGGFDKLAKGLVKFNTSILTIGFDFLIDSIKRVYELQERWAKAIGGFNMKLGGMTAGLKSATKAATQWSGTIRGLTNGDIQEGIEMFGEFTMAIGRVVKSGDGFSKLGIQLARGFNLGGKGAGDILKVFDRLNMSAGESAKAMSGVISGANLADVPVNQLGKDIEEAHSYLARFGKEGVKTFVDGAAYARKFTMSITDMQKAMEHFDSFDDAATSAAKLNAAFGLMVNSMDLMLTNDPSQRMEMIRQQFLAQGKTYDKLTPIQRRYAAETLQVSDDQLASLLSISKAGVSYADMQAKQAKKEKTEVEAKREMQRMLTKTAQTMFAFGAAFDRVTVAIGHAIKPLLVVLGLAKDGQGKKGFGGFGHVMKEITDVVVAFFESLAKNQRWTDFMKELANDMIRMGKALKEWVMNGGAADLIGRMATNMKKFYTFTRDLAIVIATMLKPLLPVFLKLAEHTKEILAGWAMMKGAQGVKGIAEVIGGAGATKKGIGRLAGAAGVGLGTGVGIAMAGGSAGQAVGGGLGSAAGMALGGPLGAAVGGMIGQYAGKALEKVFSGPASPLEQAQNALAKTMEKASNQTAEFSAAKERADKRQEIADRERLDVNQKLRDAERLAHKSKTKTITLDAEEAAQLQARAGDLALFAGSVRGGKSAVSKLAKGQNDFNDKELRALVKLTSEYEVHLQTLRDLTQKQAEDETAKLKKSDVGRQMQAFEDQISQGKSEIAGEKAKLKRMQAPGGGDKNFLAGELPKDVSSFKDAIEFLGDSAKDLDMQQSSRIQNLLYSDKSSARRYLASLKQKMKVTDLEKAQTELERSRTEKQMDYDKEIFKIDMRQRVGGSDEFKHYIDVALSGSMGATWQQKAKDNPSSLIEDFISGNRGVAESVIGKTGMGAFGFASGGIVRRPTHALIGEAGPEAVIPLRAIASGRMRQPMKFGGSAASALVGGGSSGGGGPSHVTVTIPIMLDGREISRAIVGNALRGGR